MQKPRFKIQKQLGARVARWHIFRPKDQFGYILEGLGKEHVGKFCCIVRPFLICMPFGILVYFVAIWHIFNRFGMLCEEKSGNPAWSVLFRAPSVHVAKKPAQRENPNNL
jgi:hypothetical protein